jgi:NAD/NADP transhydrogenase alpha subunit
VLTATGNVTLANPTTESVGQSGIIVFIQDGTGSRTLSLGTDYETAGAAGLTISTAASSVDIIPYFVQAADNILLGAPQLAFA